MQRQLKQKGTSDLFLILHIPNLKPRELKRLAQDHIEAMTIFRLKSRLWLLGHYSFYSSPWHNLVLLRVARRWNRVGSLQYEAPDCLFCRSPSLAPQLIFFTWIHIKSLKDRNWIWVVGKVESSSGLFKLIFPYFKFLFAFWKLI